MPFRWPVFLALALPLTASIAAEDLTIVSRVTLGDSVTTSTQYITAERSRTTDGQTDTIVHFSTGAMTMIDRNKKEYYETSLEEMSAFLDRTTRDLKGSPMEAMFGLGAEAETKKLPGKRKIAGYDCERYSVEIGDVLELDLLVTPALLPPARYYDGRKLAYAAAGPMGKLFEKMFDEMKKVKGFPLSTATIVRTPMSRTQILAEATEVRKGSIPSSTFDLPAGYKRKKSPFAR